MVTTVLEAFIGCLIISISCSPSHVIFPSSGNQCSGNVCHLKDMNRYNDTDISCRKLVGSLSASLKVLLNLS